MSAFNEFKNLMAEATAAQKKKIQDGAIVESEQIPEKSALDEFKNLIKEAAIIPKKEPKQIEEVVSIPLVEDESVAERTARFLSSSKKRDEVVENIEAQRWNDPLRRESNEKFVTFKEMNDHYSKLFGRLQQQMASIGGGGEVNFRNLDDVDRSTIGPNRHLAYNATTKKFFFEDVLGGEPQVQSDWGVVDDSDVAFIKNKPTKLSDFNNDASFISSADGGDADQLNGQEGSFYLDYTNFTNTPEPLEDDDYTISIANNVVSVMNLPANTAIGPIEQLSFNTNHIHEEERVEGTLCWDPDDRTLNLTHPDDVVQQIGQELYGKVRNNTGSTIVNGTAVRFAGASMNGSTRLEVAPFEADGAYPSIYAFGIATQDIADGEDGLVTVWGKVRDIDTTGGGENWQIGNILYVSPTTAGALTNIKPTAPNNVVPMAAVLRVDATEGEIFVRPTIEQQMSYGRFERTTDLAVAATNTPYVIDFDTTEISNGVTRVVGSTTKLQVNQSGLYQVDVSAQVDATGGGFSSGTMYMWIRKGSGIENSVDVPDSTRRQGVLASAPSTNIAFTVVISLNANDYIEIAYAGDTTSLRFDAADATAFAPSTAAVKVGITQIQL